MTSVPDSTKASSAKTNRRWVLAWLPLLVGLVLAVGVVRLGFSQMTRFSGEAAALGELTNFVLGEVDGRRIQCSDNLDTAHCIQAYVAAGKPPAVLWLGNSQLSAMNKPKLGDKTAAMLVHEALIPSGRYVVAYAQPNANLFEHRLLFGELRKTYDVRKLILPVCLDDFRETAIRESLLPPQVPTKGAAPAEKKPENLQQSVEAKLEATLSRTFHAWALRSNLKAFVDYMTYQGRNLVLGIDAQTKRPVSEAQYKEKIEVLKALLAEARAAGVKVVLYAPPYRTDIPGPYVEAQYAALLRDLQAMAVPGEVTFLDLTNVVPGSEWGMLKDNVSGAEDYDFMHFTAEGHRGLAQSLIPAI